jgi:hypothetical protein
MVFYKVSKIVVQSNFERQLTQCKPGNQLTFLPRPLSLSLSLSLAYSNFDEPLLLVARLHG